MQVHIERLSWEPVIEHHFTADEGFEGESGEHVEPETETRYVDHRVVGGEVVENVAFGFGAEG